MYFYITPLLRQKPTNIFLHIGTNDAPNKNPDFILKEILRLKLHIETELPSAKVFLSILERTMRTPGLLFNIYGIP